METIPSITGGHFPEMWDTKDPKKALAPVGAGQ